MKTEMSLLQLYIPDRTSIRVVTRLSWSSSSKHSKKSYSLREKLNRLRLSLRWSLTSTSWTLLRWLTCVAVVFWRNKTSLRVWRETLVSQTSHLTIFIYFSVASTGQIVATLLSKILAESCSPSAVNTPVWSLTELITTADGTLMAPDTSTPPLALKFKPSGEQFWGRSERWKLFDAASA